MSDTTSKLVSIPIDVTVGPETFHILPFGFETQVTLSAKLFATLAKAGFTAGDSVSFSDLVEHASDVMFWAASIAIGKPRSYWSTLDDFDDGLRILEAVYAANIEVFTKKVLPSLQKRWIAAMAKVEQQLKAGDAVSPLMKWLLASLPRASSTTELQ